MGNELVKKSDIATIDRKNIERLVEELEFLDSSILLKIGEHNQNVQQNQKIFDNQLKKTSDNIELLNQLKEKTEAFEKELESLHTQLLNRTSLEATLEDFTQKIKNNLNQITKKEIDEITNAVSSACSQIKKTEGYLNVKNFGVHSQMLRDYSNDLVQNVNKAQEVLLKVEKIRNRPTYFFLFGYGTGMITTLSIVYFLQKGIISF